MNEPTDLEVLSSPGCVMGEDPIYQQLNQEQKEKNNDLMQLFLAFPTACLSICLGLSILTISIFFTGTFLFVVDCSTTKIVFCKR